MSDGLCDCLNRLQKPRVWACLNAKMGGASCLNGVGGRSVFDRFLASDLCLSKTDRQVYGHVCRYLSISDDLEARGCMILRGPTYNSSVFIILFAVLVDLKHKNDAKLSCINKYIY